MRISDWSSDVCSSDLDMAQQQAERERQIAARDADDYRRSNSRLLATSRARRAGSGVTSQGSPLLVDEKRPPRSSWGRRTSSPAALPGPTVVSRRPPCPALGRAARERAEERRVGKAGVGTCR